MISLENDLENIEDPFLKKALSLAIDGKAVELGGPAAEKIWVAKSQ